MPTLGYLLTVEFASDLGPNDDDPVYCLDCRALLRGGDGRDFCRDCLDDGSIGDADDWDDFTGVDGDD